MRRRRIIAYVLEAVIGLVAIVLLLLFSVDLGRFKPQAEALVSDILDREFAIDGPLHLNLGDRIELSAENVRLAGTQWSAAPQLASLKALEVAVDLWSLIEGPIMIERLHVDGIRVHLEEDGDGNNNWTFFADAPDEVATDGERFQLPVLATDIHITDTVLVYDDAERSQPLRFVADTITGKIVGSNQIELTMEGEFNDAGVGLKASIGGIKNLIALRDVQGDLAGHLGEITIDGNFAFADLLNPHRPTANLNLAGPNVGYLLDRLQMERFTSGPLKLSLNITQQQQQEKMQLQLDGALGEFEVSADGRFVDLQQLQEIDLVFSAGGPDASRVAGMTGVENVPNDPFSIGGALHRSGDDISIEHMAVTIGETRFDLAGEFKDFPDPSNVRAKMRLRGPDIGRFSQLLGLPGGLDGPFSVDGELAPLPGNEGAVVDLKASTSGIKLSVGGNVLDTPQFVGSKLRLNVNGPKLSTITTAPDRDNGADIPFNVDVTAERIAGGVIVRNGRITLGDNAEYTAVVEGTITEQPGLQGSRIQVDAKGPNLAEITATAGIDGLRGFGKPFTLLAGMRVAEKTLHIESAQFQIDRTVLTADTRFSLEPLLDSGQFSLQGNSPDILPLFPDVAEMATRDTAPLDLVAEGRWVNNLWTVDRLALNVAGDTLRVEGTVGGPPDFGKTNLKLDGSFASLKQFRKIAGRPLPDKPAHIGLHLVGDDDVMTLEKLEGRVGDSDFTGEFALRYGETPDITLALTSKRLNLTPFLPPEPEAQTGVQREPTPREDKDLKVIPDTPIPMDELKKVQARFNVRVGEVNVRQQTVQDFLLVGSVEGGSLLVNQFGLKSPRGGQLDGALSLRPTRRGAELGTRINGNHLTLGLPASSQEELQKLPNYQVNIALTSEGETVREMAGAANGYLRLVAGKGEVTAGTLSMFTSDFLHELVDLVNPFASQDPYTKLNCMLVLAAVEGGQLTGEPVLVLQSDRVNIFANTKIDLRTEELNARFNTVPQKGLGFSLTSLVNPFVMVAGTLGSPTLSLDQESTLVSGGVAVVTGGLSIVAKGVTDRFLSSKEPCSDALKTADEHLKLLEAKYARDAR